MESYLLALDLDGTTCDDTGHLGEETKRALTDARAQGHIICFATGRRDIDMYSFWEESRYADYLLMNNGGKLVQTEDWEILFNDYISPDTVKQLVGHCLEEGYQLHVLSGNHWAVNRWTDGLQNYVDYLGTAPVRYSALEELPWQRVEGFMVTADLVPVCEYIQAAGLPLSCAPSEPGCVDIMAPGVSKRGGLERLISLLGIPRQRLIAAGDYNNDLEMIQYAGIGVAVANALPEVKAAADYVTQRNNNHDAVAEIVEKFLTTKEKTNEQSLFYGD